MSLEHDPAQFSSPTTKEPLARRAGAQYVATRLSTLLLICYLPSFRCLAVEANLTIEQFPTATSLRIYSDDDSRAIGHGRYTISQNGSEILLRGENRFVTGERDVELESLKFQAEPKNLALVAYRHSFFAADGTSKIFDTLDVEARKASCRWNTDGVYREASDLIIPEDTFAGAAQILFATVRLRQGARVIRFHAYNCVPEPRVISVEAVAEPELTNWSKYPGELLKMKIRPNFGWFTFLITPFIGDMEVWFDPNDHWNYVGARCDRFYKGPHVLSVRVPLKIPARQPAEH